MTETNQPGKLGTNKFNLERFLNQIDADIQAFRTQSDTYGMPVDEYAQKLRLQHLNNCALPGETEQEIEARIMTEGGEKANVLSVLNGWVEGTQRIRQVQERFGGFIDNANNN